MNTDISFICVHEVSGIFFICMAFGGHICCWYMYANSMVNKFLFYLLCAVMWVYMYTTLLVEWDIQLQFGRNISSGAYASNVKCKYTNACGGNVDCTEFI